MSSGRMLVLTADKGHSHELDLLGLGNPSLAHHRGGVSMMVNYHALGELMAQQEGFMLAQVSRSASLEVCALALTRGEPLPETRLAFDQVMERVGPTDVYRLIDRLALDKMTLDELLAVLRMASWDPITFISLARDLHRCAGDGHVEELARLREALQRVWALHFPLADGKDVAFEMGFVYYAMRRYREAMGFYRRSVAMYGEHHVTLFNMGLCQYQQGRLDEALVMFERSLVREPGYAPARDWRLRMLAERGGEAEPEGDGDAAMGPPAGLARVAAEDGAAPVVVGVADAGEGRLAPGAP
jgi:tetratricopeptide (TPR) repeat protein